MVYPATDSIKGVSIMAYQTQNNRFSKPAAGSNNNRQGSSQGGAQREKVPALLSTGLFAPKSEKSKAKASVVTEITTDIKAGTTAYFDLYENTAEEVAAGKPMYKLVIKEAKKRA
jgi:hypothetical protein